MAKSKPYIATRGSFESKQAEFANHLLSTQYKSAICNLDPKFTYMFEIIYPQNRIVVDYGAREELVLLAIIETATGQESPLQDLGFPLVKHYDGLKDISKLKEIAFPNEEGFVIKFENNLRVKVKFEEYIRLHRLVTQVSTLTIWESLMMEDKEDFKLMLENIPDELYKWVRHIEATLKKEYARIEAEAKAEYKFIPDRRKNAAYFLTCKHTKILFAMLDKKEYSNMIWRMIRPEFEKGGSF